MGDVSADRNGAAQPFGVRRLVAALVRGGLTPLFRKNATHGSRDRSRKDKALTPGSPAGQPGWGGCKVSALQRVARHLNPDRNNRLKNHSRLVSRVSLANKQTAVRLSEP